jgi:hypothetical protein
MSAQDVRLEAERLGITLRLHNGKVLARPLSAVTLALTALMKANKQDLMVWLHERELELVREAEIDRLAEADTDPITPAQSVIATCQRLHIPLRLSADGRLTLGRSDLCGKEPAIPPSLVMAV